MEEYEGYAGRLLADRYRLPLPPADEYELAESLAWDTASGQEVLVRQVPLPEVVDAEVMDDGSADGYGRGAGGGPHGSPGRATRRPADPVVRRAVEAAVAASRVPDHPRLDQVFDVFVEADGLWIVSELVPARPLAALLAERPLGAHRAAEIAADLLAALGIVHAHGWAHRNITIRTVLICEDGRALLTGLSVGAAEEALCGYDPLPPGGGTRDRPGPVVPAPGGGTALDPSRGQDAGAPRTGDGVPPARGGGPAARGTGPTGRAGPATWTGQALPDGFLAREGGPGGGGSGAGPGRGYGSARGDARSRGIFGFEGVEPRGEASQADERGREPNGPQGPGGSAGSAPQGSRPPVAHGYGTAVEGTAPGAPDEVSARAARRGAIAAYRAGAQRAAAEFRESGARESGRRPGAEGGQEPVTDWWSTSSGSGSRSGDGSDGRVPEQGARQGGALDDDVRWLPSDEDEVRPGTLGSEGTGGTRRSAREEIYGPRATGPYGQRRTGPESGPTSLPGVRPGGSRSVPASWHTRAVEAGVEQGGERSREPDTGGNEGLRIFEPPPGGPYESGGPYEGAAEDEGGAEDEGPASPHAFVEPGAFVESGPFVEPGDGERPWGLEEAGEGRYRGPATALAAERARHARMTVVGPVTERWAPEQAGPVYENWRLAPPVGPAADLWALGALLFRCVQGHAPYPEDSAAELVQMVCAEPPAFAEDCGPLRPVVESLMRQDPTERPDFEELRGWLRSLIRSAPEPEVGLRTVTAPPLLEPGEPSDPRRLPIVRRRGELVRRRRRDRRFADGAPPRRERQRGHGREREEPPAPERGSRSRGEPEMLESGSRPERGRKQRHKRARSAENESAGPQRLGRLILGLVLLGLTAAVLFVMLFMPGQEKGGGEQKGSVVVPEEGGTSPGGKSEESEESKDGKDAKDPESKDGKDPKGSGGSKGAEKSPGTTPSKAPKGYKTSRDPAGFEIAVPQKWDRRSANARGQVRYNGGEVEMVLAHGRDTTKKYGKDPMAYQSEHEPELAAYRAADWASTGGLRRIDVGSTAMAEGTFKWREQGGRKVYARNRAMILDGRYHVLLVIGSESHKKEIDRHFEAVADTYRVTRR
ncbi:hypothetical protein OG533_23120 [Streptomyces sp. NBC_01186]|uniref:hypothetical protein n=1 Tax=Streptomyces sp. NBC_01186 TaxID=2903765 RepID=UPI002E15675E|nr:hypothetical protein OG533_23120 [Streptomyces sp. NBC_01186]